MYYWDAHQPSNSLTVRTVSVVVRRMYYWDAKPPVVHPTFQPVSVVVRRMYYWDITANEADLPWSSFSSC